MKEHPFDTYLSHNTSSENPIVSAKAAQIPPFMMMQDDPAIKKRLQTADLRKREFDRKLESNLRAIESVISGKIPMMKRESKHSHQMTFGGDA